MSDATDAVKQAITMNKRLAAQHMVRAEELSAQLDKLKRDRAEAEADPQLAADFDAKIAEVNTQFLAAKHDYEAAMKELSALGSLGGKALAADAKTIAASIHGDPLIRSNEQIALDNVRERAADLDAHQKLAEELGERPRVVATPKPSREQADDDARRAFEALRAKQQAPAAPAAPAEPDTAEPAPQGPPKKTL